jgi:ABC-type nitrate/sulfonate/bicarbonate transport system ATPase subunit
MSALLELRDVSHWFGPRRVLQDVNLTLDEGEFVCIVGYSGSGKSTLLNIASGLMKPASGQVFFEGRPFSGFLSGAAMVFQNYSLLPWLSALDNVLLAVESAHPHWPRERQTEQAVRYLTMAGLGQALAKKPRQLSGGMRQRVAIARALAVEPRLLFLDEPFGALDALTRSHLQKELLKMVTAGDRRLTVLMITNSVDEAVLLANRIHALSRGPSATLSPPLIVDGGNPDAARACVIEALSGWARQHTALPGQRAGRTACIQPAEVEV